jgi:hypothetical protein
MVIIFVQPYLLFCEKPFLIIIGLQYIKRVNRSEYEIGRRCLQSFTYFFHLTITHTSKKITLFAAPLSLGVKN